MTNYYWYVGRRACGCIAATISDRAALRKVVAKTLAMWVEEDLTVDRVPAADLGGIPLIDFCPHQNRQLPLPVPEVNVEVKLSDRLP